MKVPGQKMLHPRMPVITIGHLWAGLPLFILLWKCFVLPLPLLDFWWHLKAGEVIVESRAIPRTDMFSFTAAGMPFVHGNWLAEVIYFLLYRMGGLELIVFSNALLVTAAFLPVYHLCWEGTSRQSVRVFSAALAALSFFVGVRTQVFSFLFFAVYYWVLNGFQTRRRDLLWTLPVSMIFWVNLHGGFVLGLILIGLFLGAEGANTFLGSNPAKLTTGDLRKVALILLLCIVATVANPETYSVYSYVRAVASDPSSQRLVTEWQPPRIETAQGILRFFGPFFAVLIVLILSGKRPNLTDVILFVASAAFGLTAMRNGIWFIILSAPLLARYFPVRGAPADRMAPSLPVASAAISEQYAATDMKRHRPLDYILASVALLVLVMVSPWVRPRIHGGVLLARQTPVGAVDFIRSERIEGRMFHPQEYGDYLIWRVWPQQRSFIDGRVHLFSEPLVRDYQRVFYDSSWEKLLLRYGIRYLLLNKDPDLPERADLIDRARKSERWIRIYEDNLSVLFEKSDIKAPALIRP